MFGAWFVWWVWGWVFGVVGFSVDGFTMVLGLGGCLGVGGWVVCGFWLVGFVGRFVVGSCMLLNDVLNVITIVGNFV